MKYDSYPFSFPYKAWEISVASLGYDILNLPSELFIVDPTDTLSEANHNMCCLAFSNEELMQITQSEIESFIKLILLNRKSIITLKNADTMLFYLWHDQQSGNLCFSFISGTFPPFNCKLKKVPSMGQIIKSYFCDQGGFISWDELTEISTNNEDQFVEKEYILNIYMERI